MLRILSGSFWVAHESVVNIITIGWGTMQGASRCRNIGGIVRRHFLWSCQSTDVGLLLLLPDGHSKVQLHMYYYALALWRNSYKCSGHLNFSVSLKKMRLKKKILVFTAP